MKLIFKRLVVMGLIATLTFGCAGREAHPVMVQQYGDMEKSCSSLEQEMAFIETEIHRLIPESEKAGENVLLGVAGAFLIFPWFFMDLSKAEQVEINAYRQRYNQLLILANEKECGIDKQPIPDPKEAAKQAREAKKAAAKGADTKTVEATTTEEKPAAEPQ